MEHLVNQAVAEARALLSGSSSSKTSAVVEKSTPNQGAESAGSAFRGSVSQEGVVSDSSTSTPSPSEPFLGQTFSSRLQARTYIHKYVISTGFRAKMVPSGPTKYTMKCHRWNSDMPKQTRCTFFASFAAMDGGGLKLMGYEMGHNHERESESVLNKRVPGGVREETGSGQDLISPTIGSPLKETNSEGQEVARHTIGTRSNVGAIFSYATVISGLTTPTSDNHKANSPAPSTSNAIISSNTQSDVNAEVELTTEDLWKTYTDSLKKLNETKKRAMEDQALVVEKKRKIQERIQKIGEEQVTVDIQNLLLEVELKRLDEMLQEDD